MTDFEFEVLDELYFIVPFQQLLSTLNTDEEKLRDCLSSFLKKSWIRCYKNVSEEIPTNEIAFESDYKKYYYLATKEGLMAHNLG